MRLWSIYPGYLDSKGLVALWREGLLARKVLMGQTRGYTQHPQLLRFKQTPMPIAAIDMYLSAVYDESKSRGYTFDQTKITYYAYIPLLLPITVGQREYETKHLVNKLEVREPARVLFVGSLLHPLFYEIEGKVEHWEIAY